MPCCWRMRRASSGVVAAGSVVGGVVVGGRVVGAACRRRAVARSWSSRGRSIPPPPSRRRQDREDVVATRVVVHACRRRRARARASVHRPGRRVLPRNPCRNRAPPSSASARRRSRSRSASREAEVACRAITAALDDAGLAPRDVDGLCLYDIESNTDRRRGRDARPPGRALLLDAQPRRRLVLRGRDERRCGDRRRPRDDRARVPRAEPRPARRAPAPA